MPDVKALKTFDSRYGKVRTGETFSCEQGYAVALKANGLIELLGGEAKADREPQRTQAFTSAPLHKDGDTLVGKGTADPSGAGGGKPFASSRADPASRPPIAQPSKPASAKR
jgi:hypothetical protein